MSRVMVTPHSILIDSRQRSDLPHLDCGEEDWTVDNDKLGCMQVAARKYNVLTLCAPHSAA
jgi:hypothetical protein